MGDITTGTYIENVSEASAFVKKINVRTAATADTGDTFTITLADYNATTIVGILGDIQTTVSSIVEREAPTTIVADGVLTVTLGGSAANNFARYYEISLV